MGAVEISSLRLRCRLTE